MSKPSSIGEVANVALPTYAEGPRCTYPSGQAARGTGGDEIKAQVFREGAVKDKAEKPESRP